MSETDLSRAVRAAASALDQSLTQDTIHNATYADSVAFYTFQTLLGRSFNLAGRDVNSDEVTAELTTLAALAHRAAQIMTRDTSEN